MSPLSFHTFRTIPTTLDLNGPSLSFTTQPSDVTVSIGETISLTGVATISISTFSGTINYQWYNSSDGVAVSNGERTNTAGSISTISGATSENITILNAQYQEDDADQYYLEASYTPAGYGSDTIANPANEPLNSSVATITIPFSITIDVQPSPDTDATISDFAEFTVVASTSANDPDFDARLTYQWSLDGENLSDSDEIKGTRSSTLEITKEVGTYSIKCTVGHQDSATTVDTDSVSYVTVNPDAYIYSEVLENFVDRPITSRISSFNLNQGPFNATGPSDLNFFFSPNTDLDVIIEMTAAGGTDYSGYQAGQGGWGVFRVTLKKNVEYLLKLGSTNGKFGPLGGRIDGTINGGIGGGGSWFYKQNRPIAILGGGGGAGALGTGGDGGGFNIDGQRGGGRRGGKGGKGNPSGRGIDNFSGGQPNEGIRIRSRFGGPTAACISPRNDYFRDVLGLSDCINYYTLVTPNSIDIGTLGNYNPFLSEPRPLDFTRATRTTDGRVVFFSAKDGFPFFGSNVSTPRGYTGPGVTPTSSFLFRGFRQGTAGRLNGGWGTNGNGGGGGGGAFGGDGSEGNMSGGGGASGYADTGEIEVLRTVSGASNGDATVKIQQATDLLAQAYRNGTYDPSIPALNIQSVSWNDSRNSGYKQGPKNSEQNNENYEIGTGNGSQSNPSNSNWITRMTADNNLIRNDNLFFSPEVLQAGDFEATKLSYFIFNLLFKGVKHKTSDNSYLNNNRGNRDSSKGVTRRWYTETQSLLNTNSELFTNDKNEAFVPYYLEFSISLSFETGGKWKVMTIPYGGLSSLKYEYKTFETRHDISFTSRQLAEYFGITENYEDYSDNKILTDYNETDPSTGAPRYNYSNPRINYIKSRIVNLDTDKINDLNLFMEFDNEDRGVNDNFIDIGKYVLT